MMDAFAIIGFIFGLSAFATTTRLTSQLKGLKEELEGLKREVARLLEER
jgi:hypothetical protein